MRSCPLCGSTYTSGVEHCGLDGSPLEEGDHLEGRIVGNYVVEAPLGMGGVSIVYRARHLSLGTRVALKLLLGETASRPVIAERFRREAQATSRIVHPNVVRVLDFGTTAEGLTFIAMEYLEGVALSDVIAGGPVAEGRARAIATDVARGLGAAHRLGFLHRDLKPGNIMLVVEGDREVAKILDFGLVGLADESVGPRLTQQGTIMGTPHYIAPEILGGLPATSGSDLYALGVTLYEMLAGRPPFDGDSFQEVMAGHLSGVPRPLDAFDGLGPLALRLMWKDPSSRPTLSETIRILEVPARRRRAPLAAAALMSIVVSLVAFWPTSREVDVARPAASVEPVERHVPAPVPPIVAAPPAPSSVVEPPVAPKARPPRRSPPKKVAAGAAIVVLDSDPPGATVTLEGRGVLGRTPIEAILDGEHQWLVFELEGSKRKRARWRRGTDRVRVAF